MTPITLRIGRRTYHATLPQGWAEVPSDAWSDLYALIAQDQGYTRATLGLLMRDRKGRKLANKVIQAIPSLHLKDFFDVLGWMAAEGMTSPHAESIKVNRTRYYLPGPQFRNLTVVEFAFLDMAWQIRMHFLAANQLEQAAEWQARLLAYCLRPADPQRQQRSPETYEGDLRERFNPALAEERWEQMKKLPAWEQAWVMRFIAGCKRHIADAYPGIWPRDESDYREALAKAARQKPPPRRWLDLVRRMSGGKFGDYETTMYTGLYSFLDELQDQIRDAKRRERDAAARKAMRK